MNLKLSDYIKKWDLNNPKLVAETATSNIYFVDREEPLVLKIYTELGAKDEINGAIALSTWAGQGAVRLSLFHA